MIPGLEKPIRNARGRPVGSARHDPDYVRRISLQVVIEHMNNNPDLLARKMEDDPTFASRLWNVAVASDSRVRGVLDILADNPCLYAKTIRAIESVVREVARLYYSRALLDGSFGGPIAASDEKIRRDSLAYVEIVSGIMFAKHRVDTDAMLNLMLPAGNARSAQTEGSEHEGL
jgi:hypothetical protein